MYEDYSEEYSWADIEQNHMECKRRVKYVTEESKMKVDKDFGRNLSELY